MIGIEAMRTVRTCLFWASLSAFSFGCIFLSGCGSDSSTKEPPIIKGRELPKKK